MNNKIFKAIIGMTAFASLLNILGCVSGPRGIAIVELDTMRTHRIRTRGERWEEILSVKADRFFTLQETDNMLVLRSRDFQGALIRETWLPLYESLYYIRNKTISDDGNRFVSFERASKAIKMWDLSDNTERTLLPDAGDHDMRIMKVEFISDDEILIAMDSDPDFGRDEAQILKYHIPSQSLKVVRTMPRLGRARLSPSGRFLAFTDDVIRNNLAVLDLETGDMAANRINEPGTMTGTFSWSPDETKIAYYVSGVNQSISIYDIREEESSVFRELDKGEICYNLLFMDNQHIIYRTGQVGGRVRPRDRPIRIANIESGETVRTVDNVVYWGGLYLAEGGRRIIFIYQ